ncbi:YkgJ family cysteine cluster protein [bacterium]|nr:YkgJ family cysteine cluster protein [bacterium]
MLNQFTNEQLANYKVYLNLIEERMLNKYFEEQKPYIFCKAGCSHCCEKGEYPVTKIELAYLLLGFSQLPFDLKTEIIDKIKRLKIEKLEYEQNRKNTDSVENFMYECPFLKDNKCSVYEFRAVICRTHGLMFFIDDENSIEPKNKIPYCVHLGLNYSNIYDAETDLLSEDKMKALGITQKPLAYNLSLKTLFNSEITKNLGFEFGEVKALIDWFPD